MEHLLIFGILGVGGLSAFAFLWNKPVLLIYLQLIYCCTIEFAISYFHLPSALRYLMDLINICIVLMSIFKMKTTKNFKYVLPIVISVGLFFFITLISYVINAQPFYLYLWGMRNIFRFYGFFLGCVLFLEKKDIKNIIDIFSVILGVNAIFCTYQYFVQGYRMDYNGGLFGVELGCNANMNIFITQLSIVAILLFQYKKRKFWYTAYVIGISLYIAALSELKMFFFELIFALVIAFLLSKPNKRTMGILIVSIGSVFIMAKFFLFLYPNWQGIFEFDNMMAYSTSVSYGSEEGSLNRMVGVQYIYNNYLKTIPSKLFGIGMGAGDYSSYFSSSFYDKHSVLNYTWFSHIWMMLENGILGVITYLGIFGVMGYQALKYAKNAIEGKEWYLITAVSAVVCLVYFCYNPSLRVEIAYVLQFYLAIGFIYAKETNGNYNKERWYQINDGY